MRKALIALMALAVVWAFSVVLTGGIDFRPYGIPFKSTDPDRAVALAAVLSLVYVLLFREHARAHLRAAEDRAPGLVATISRRAPLIALALAAAVFVLGVVYGIHVAGGSDSYGYISQADLWLKGDLVIEQPIVQRVPWPDARWTFTPLGYRPTDDGTAIVPTYSYGLPVMMAAAKLVAGMCGLFLVTPLLGALMVGMTYALGAQVWSRGIGLAAAALMATSPAFLFMQMNPMSDVPVSGVFTAALVVSLSRRRWAPLWTGALVSLALFVRPNLVPLGAIFLGWYVLRATGWAERLRAAVAFGLGGLPLMTAIAVTNALVHGAPWSSGYGPLDAYYSWGYFFTNLRLYGVWLLESETPFVLLLFVPLLVMRRFDRETRARLAFIAAFAAGVWFCYVFYTPYDAWWYLRFYLPAFPPMLILAAMGVRHLLSRLPASRRAVAVAAVVAGVLIVRIDHVQEQAILRLWESGTVYTSAAEYVRRELPPNAVILTVQHSGSMRYYADRLTVRWDWIGPQWWPRALVVLREMGYRPYLLVSRFEDAQLRTRFGFGEDDDAPGTVMADSPSPFGVVLYDPLREYAGPRRAMPMVIPCPCAVR